MKREQRPFTVRAEGDDGGAPTRIVGYAAVFNQVAHGEMIQPGAFTKSLKEQRDIKAYWAHDATRPLGRTKNGTLIVEQDAHGLRVEIRPNLYTTFGRDALESVIRGDVDQMSFGMDIINSKREIIDGQEVTVLTEIRLHEVSPVANPWYEGTLAQARDSATTSSRNDDGPEPPPVEHSTRNDAAVRLRTQCALALERLETYMEEQSTWMS